MNSYDFIVYRSLLVFMCVSASAIMRTNFSSPSPRHNEKGYEIEWREREQNFRFFFHHFPSFPITFPLEENSPLLSHFRLVPFIFIFFYSSSSTWWCASKALTNTIENVIKVVRHLSLATERERPENLVDSFFESEKIPDDNMLCLRRASRRCKL